MSKYKGLFTFDVENHRYLPVEQADGIITDMDYHPEPEPKEPLIKDEKIRKAVRAWAEANGFTKLKFNEWSDNHWILRAENKDGHEFDVDFFDIDCKKLPKYVYDAFYTIAELCGEEEE